MNRETNTDHHQYQTQDQNQGCEKSGNDVSCEATGVPIGGEVVLMIAGIVFGTFFLRHNG